MIMKPQSPTATPVAARRPDQSAGTGRGKMPITRVKSSYTDTQGQYLAFIYYIKIHSVPPVIEPLRGPVN